MLERELQGHGPGSAESCANHRQCHIVPFVLVMCLGLALVMIFPQIALWLPNLYYGK
jgi:TRAP-type mannitol/chloroaromatic compound transport system permease large subunit